MKIFAFSNYKDLVNQRLLSMPKRGRGELQKIAKQLGMHTTAVSHVLRGNKDFTLEQACGLADYLGLSPLETRYFVTLVHLERAGNERLRQILRADLASLREQSLELVNRMPRDQTLSEENKALFYSNWYYSAIRLLTSVPGYRDVDRISDYLGLPKQLVARVLDFLLASGLCLEKEGQIEMGPKRTHLEAQSPLIARHHQNWRIKAMERLDKLSPKNELAFTAPMTLALQDAERVRDLLADTAQKVRDLATESEAEQLYCFNVDWFKVT